MSVRPSLCWSRVRRLADRGSAGVIPYYQDPDGRCWYLLQYNQTLAGQRRQGWSDWGGKAEDDEISPETAARELIEETGGVLAVTPGSELYHDLAGRREYTPRQASLVYQMITDHRDRVAGELIEISREIPSLEAIGRYKVEYRVYFWPVREMIPASHLPLYEDGHLGYRQPYLRLARWWSREELSRMSLHQLHIRLRKTRLLEAIRAHGRLPPPR